MLVSSRRRSLPAGRRCQTNVLGRGRDRPEIRCNQLSKEQPRHILGQGQQRQLLGAGLIAVRHDCAAHAGTVKPCSANV